MKRLILSLIFLAPLILLAQSPIQVSSPYQYNKYVKVLDSLVSKNVIIPRVAAFPTPKQTGQIVNKQDTVCFWNGSQWVRIRKVTWPEDSVRYASKSGVRSDTVKLHNQIVTKLAISDTVKLHNQIATKQPQLSGTGFVKASGTTITYDNTTYQPAGSYLTSEGDPVYVGDSSTIMAFIRNHTQVEFPIVASDTTIINIGSILTHELINIENYIIKLPSNYQSGSIRIMPKGFNLFVDNERIIDTNSGQGIGVSILFALVDTDIKMSVINTNAETGTIKFTVNNIYTDTILNNGVWNDTGVWIDSQPMF